MQTIPDDFEASPEWGRLKDVQRLFGIRRSNCYELIRLGEIRSAAVRKKNARNGVRLIDLESVREFLRSQSSV